VGRRRARGRVTFTTLVTKTHSIALDATYSVGEDLSGVGVYSQELLYGLSQTAPDEQFQWCFRPHRLLKSRTMHLPRNCRRRLLLDGWLPRAALFHGLNQRLPQGKLPRTITTFHDLFVLTGEYSTREFRERFAAQARDAAARSERIIAVSAFTASQVRDLLCVEPERIRVIPHGIRFRSRVADVSSPPRQPTVLTVGAIQKRKNMVRLVRAFEALEPKCGWRLVIAGSPSGYGSGEVLERIERSPARNRIDVLGYVTAAELERLYLTAMIFAFPSMDEGFGMPVLEAMAAGTPVLASNRSALPEVCGDAALLVDPNNQQGMEEALTRLVADAELRQHLSQLGQARAQLFSWERASSSTWQVYQELLSPL
jgi:glycosyltransferase involved in cell wall biosynthesis